MSSNNLKSIRKQALELIRLGEKVYNYRKDVIEPTDVAVLKNNTLELEGLYKGKSKDTEAYTQAIEAQTNILKRTGGTFWHNRAMSENVETIIVVAIVIFAFRIFFFQPFVIPTSSMYPTYSGMQSNTYEMGASSPNVIEKVALKLFRGGSHYKLVAQSNGEISIPIDARTGRPAYQSAKGRKWLILPATKKEYVIYIGKNPHSIIVPAEYDLTEVISETFGISFPVYAMNSNNQLQIVPTGYKVETGDTALQFDILMGDALFVNRFWYHFAKPKSGDAIVFRTDSFKDRKKVGDLRIPAPHRVGEDKFYIKRLVGEPGQTLEVKNYRLLQNGEPATGAGAFEKNALQEDEYPGYRNVSILNKGKTYTIPEDHVFAMGDNSANSKDSRYFGPVPQEKVIGSAVFIYYPFTKRWGLAK